MNTKRPIDIVATTAALILLAAALTGCHRQPDVKLTRPPSPVTVAEAQEAPVLIMAETFGRLRSTADVNVQAQVSGKIVASPFTEGTMVKQGETLFEIERDVYQAAMDDAAAQVAGAKADLVQKQATLARNKPLVARGLVSSEDYEQLETAVEAAQANLQQAEAALAKARINLGYCTVAAPTAGMTGKRLVDVGNLVAGTGNQPLVNVRSLDPLYLDFTLSESYLPAVRQAMTSGVPVSVIVIAESVAHEPGLYEGRLQTLDNTVDTASGTISMRAVVDNPQNKLWPGQFVYAYPILDTLPSAVIVPQSAITEGKNGPYAFVVSNGVAALRMVTKGPLFGDAIVADSGLQKGDQVVTSGQLGVWPGAPVQIKPEADAERQALIRKRSENPNVQTLARILAAKGETPEQIAILMGLPVDVVNRISPPAATP